MQFLARQLVRWPAALAAVVVLGAVLLLPALGSGGLWEPQERQLADRIAPRRTGKVAELIAIVAPAVDTQVAIAGQRGTIVPPPNGACPHVAPHDAVARSLTARAIGWGRDAVADSDAGRRLPLALLGLLAVVATAGIAMRLSGPRAGVLVALVMLTMPLLVFQARQLTSEIGTATGGALIVYGLCAVESLGRIGLVAVVDVVFGVLALALGLALGFASGGALLGVAVPLGAVAAAGGLGIPAARRLTCGLGRMLRAARARTATTPSTDRGPTWPALLATLGAAVVLGVLAYQVFSLRPAEPPHRDVLGHSIVPTSCWSSALGGIWRADDDLRYIFDSTFEQIAYGTFPWGVLAPIAMASLLAAPGRKGRQLGALSLAWASGAWIASEVFQRKVGFTLYAGFPAFALAVGSWLDGVLWGRARNEQGAMPRGAMLIALYAALAVLDLGKDLQATSAASGAFTDRITSLLVGSSGVPYPADSRLLLLPSKVWILVLGMIVALGFAVTMFVWRDHDRGLRKLAARAAGVALAGSAMLAAFWAYAWPATLSYHLSSKPMFDTYQDLRKDGDQLVILGDLGDAPHDYAPETTPEVVTSRDQLVAALGRKNRVFAISPQTELCQLHRELAGKPYYVIENRNARSLLLSNSVEGTTDKNPLATMVVHAAPKDIAVRPKARIVWDNKIELLGWDIPASVGRSSKFEVKMYYHVLQPVGSSWKVLFHFDGPSGLRFNGDHDPIDGRCQTSTWQKDDYIIDTYTVMAGGTAFPKESYDVWTGFWTGSAPNYTNMAVSEAPGNMRDTANRVKITTITLD